jgi:ankyrin repeat protein
MEMVKLLVERGSDVNARDDDGKSALDLAVERKHEEVAGYFENEGSEVGGL